MSVPLHFQTLAALADRLQWCADNAARLPAMGEASRARAARWTWDDFVQTHNRLIIEFVGSGRNGAKEHHA